jgi:hypothetical protein
MSFPRRQQLMPDFLQPFMEFYSTQRRLPPSDFTVSEDTGIKPRTVSILALVDRRLNHSARFLRTTPPNTMNATSIFRPKPPQKILKS